LLSPSAAGACILFSINDPDNNFDAPADGLRAWAG
jgi:hypothetical protein